MQRDYSTAALCRWIASSRAQSSASWSGKKERRGKRESLGREEGSFSFPLYETKLTLVQFFLFLFFFLRKQGWMDGEVSRGIRR